MNAANAAKKPTVPQLSIPVPEPPLSREQLLVAALHAASDFAAGVSDAKLQQDLADKKFEFRMRFGCDEPGSGKQLPFDWSFNPKTQALKVRATPELSAKDPAVKAIAGEAFESVEGFWIKRPWLLAATCPAPAEASPQPQEAANSAKPDKSHPEAKSPPPAQPSPAPPPDHSLGIAQFFTATGPRTMRRSGRPYEATKKLDESAPPSGGFDLVIAGRLAALPDGRVIACTRSQSDERPDCVISVEFGTVSIERADTHEQIAQWGSG